jgi:hypothetical protein
LSNRFDSLSSWVKEEDLVVVLSVVSLDHQVSSSNSQNSLHWESRSDDESSSEMDLVWNIESSSLSVFSLVNIVDVPLLAQLVCELSDSNILALTVLPVENLDDSAILDIL